MGFRKKDNAVNTSLHGRMALVTGATGYLGREIALALGTAGATVLVNGRSAEACNALVAELKKQGLGAESASFDLTEEDAVEDYFAEYGDDRALHILVNNAHSGRGGTLETATSDDFRLVYEINVVAAHRLMQRVLPHLRLAVQESGDASIVNVISMYGLVSPDLRNYDSPEGTNPPFYGAAKAGLAQLTRYAAVEFGRQGIRCNGVSPGPFPSPQARERTPETMQRLTDRVPLGRLGRGCEIGPPISFLASPGASFITGAILPVDGGWTAW